MHAREPLAGLTARLRCPHCNAPLTASGRSITCERGHSYDLARGGYVSLLPPRGRPHPGDSAAMVAAREEFLGAGHFGALAAAVTAAARDAAGPIGRRDRCAVDLGAGTGYYLAALLEGLEGWRGLALDASRPALRRAVRARSGIGAVACDVWQPLPLQEGAADLVLDVFAPRNGPEIARVLAPDGALIVVTPTAAHLRQLVPTLGMLEVDPDKQARLVAQLSPGLASATRRRLEFDIALGHADIRALAAMGPSAHHLSETEIEERMKRIPGELNVTASVTIETFRHA